MSQSELEKLVAVLRETLHRHDVKPQRFILFGSRARGEVHPDSDWDIYVLIDRELTSGQRRDALTEIKRTLARSRIPNDIVLRDTESFNSMKDHPGTLAYEVAREGIVL